MRLLSIRVRNYKSFSDSDVIPLASKFNVLLGQNNSGKSALLEGLRHRDNPNNPHRDLKIRRDAIANPQSIFDLEAQVTANELFDSLMQAGGSRWIPIRRGENSKRVAEILFKNEGTTAKIEFGGGNILKLPQRLSHTQYVDDGASLAFRIDPSPDRQSYAVSDVTGTGDDGLGALIPPIIASKIFMFDAERVSLHQAAVASPSRISSNAGNLARALLAMAEDPFLWDEFNLNVNRILPNVKRVVPAIIEGSNNVEVRLWPVDPKEQRADLMVPLAKSGTGVGQVLSILCAAMTVRQAVIGIDEPSNFLHPGAVKALFAILNAYDHQYVVTTHSLDVIAASGDSKVYMVKWKDCVSSVQEVKIGNFREHKAVLAELGVSLSDVLGMETLLWVEGETEEICIPRVVQKVFGYTPGNVGVVRVRSVSELADKKKGEAFWDVYKMLSSSGGSVPATTRFVFDREVRSQQELNDIRRASGGEAAFLPRRTFENYLLDTDIVLQELNSEAAVLGLDVITAETLSDWIDANAARYAPQKEAGWRFDRNDDEWKREVDAPQLLNALFKALLNSEYRKTRNSPSLTSRMLAAGGKDAVEIESFVAALLGR